MFIKLTYFSRPRIICINPVYMIRYSYVKLFQKNIEKKKPDSQDYVKSTKRGKTKLDTIRLLGEDALVSRTWDGYWRIIILDLPEERKNERESLRYLLKKANFACVKNTVWISPLPYENLFINIKKDLGLSTELMIIIADKLDEQTRLAFLNAIKE